jgi:hypothetical protein
MSEQMSKEEAMNHHWESLKHWRAWGSWFSWGSPVGLGLFVLALAGAYWIVVNA